MKYQGGKNLKSKIYAECIEKNRKNGQIYWEPFLGGCNILNHIKGERVGFEKNIHLAELWKQLIDGTFKFPDHQISELEYKEYRELSKQSESLVNANPMIAFVGFGLSWGGKWFGGYGRDSKGKRNYQKETERCLIKKVIQLQGAKVYQSDYRDLKPEGKIILCDPPYYGTTQYTGVGNFDSVEFWNIMTNWAENNDVFVCEYQSLISNVEEVSCIQHKLSIRSKTGCDIRKEKIFKVIYEK